MAEDSAEMTPVEETEPALAQRVAELVRARSRNEAKLTPLDRVQVDGTLLDEEQKAELIDEILGDESCRDLRVMRSSAGKSYIYCTAHITDTYARILFRVEEGNPYELVASTVREESEIYPRPTTAELFREPEFGLDPQRVEQLVEEMGQLERYRDVKPITASTGALYLYSSRFLDGDWAKSLVEWEEVGRRQNP